MIIITIGNAWGELRVPPLTPLLLLMGIFIKIKEFL
jgi:hypothetical protein